MERGRTFDKIISVLAAILIWAYIINIVNPVEDAVIKNVPVTLTNTASMESSELAIAGSGEYTVDLVVAGARKDLTGLSGTDFSATADVSGLHIGQNYINVAVDGPSSIAINEIRTQRIQVYVDTAVTESRNIDLEGLNLNDGTELGNVYMDTQTVELSGAKSLVDSVVSVKAEIDAGTMPDGETVEVPLVAVNSDGSRVIGVKLSTDTIHVSATILQTKRVALNVPITGMLPETVELISSIVPESVTVRGRESVLSNIWQLDAAPIDISGITESVSIPVSVNLPSGVELALSSRDLNAEYTVVPVEIRTFTVDPQDIVLEGLPEGTSAELIFEQPLVVTVKGRSEYMTDVTAESLTVTGYIDASGESAVCTLSASLTSADAAQLVCEIPETQPEVKLITTESDENQPVETENTGETDN